VKTLRCAIYTRKSTEEGLDQAFNSLDAQREACEAYIASQRHEGWKLIKTRYDDGGRSGGSMEREGLQALLSDIEAGGIDLVVVYKVDRLTRSLADFAKLVDRFDAARCSFVSVTQAFNTASSMGRLTLNVLLSFAQFEREVTAERIRDKIAASKAKGYWMGGLAPLGYDPAPGPERTLVINDAEARSVRRIFELYAELEDLKTVAVKAEELGIRSKRRLHRSGKQSGGLVMSHGQIHFILTNPVYVGKIRHKDTLHDGLHPPIIDEPTWTDVQTKLQTHATKKRRRCSGSDTLVAPHASSPLAGKLFDETGDRLTPSHTVRKAKGKVRRHRYYVSRRLITTQTQDPAGWRLPAVELERCLTKAVVDHIQARGLGLIACPQAASENHSGILERIEQLSAYQIGTVLDLIERVDIARGRLSIALKADVLAEAVGVEAAALNQPALAFKIGWRTRRRGVETRIVSGETAPKPDQTLIRAIARAHAWVSDIRNGTSIAEIAAREQVTECRIREILPLGLMAPRLVEQILEGKQPPGLTLEVLRRQRLPIRFDAQADMIAKVEPH
jgi:site-specific DNA recombinase